MKLHLWYHDELLMLITTTSSSTTGYPDGLIRRGWVLIGEL